MNAARDVVHEKDQGEPRAAPAVKLTDPGRESIIQNGSFTTTMPIDESQVPVGIESNILGPIVALDSAITVCAVFPTGIDPVNNAPEQPDPAVREAVGASGQNLKGSPNVEVFGELTKTPTYRIEVQTRVEHPYAGLGELAAREGRRPRCGRSRRASAVKAARPTLRVSSCSCPPAP